MPKCRTSVAYPPGELGDVSPRFQAEGDSHAKVSPHFLIHNDAIAGFISQSLGLPAYACKTDSYKCNKIINSQNAPKLAILSSKTEKFPGRGIAPSPDRSPVGRGTFPNQHPLPSRRWCVVPRARHDSSAHLLNRGEHEVARHAEGIL